MRSENSRPLHFLSGDNEQLLPIESLHLRHPTDYEVNVAADL